MARSECNGCPEPAQTKAKEETTKDKDYTRDKQGSDSGFSLDKESNMAVQADIPRSKLVTFWT